MEETKIKKPGLVEDISNLAETYVQLAKAKATQKAANVASVSISGFAMIILTIFFIFFGGAALALWIGDILNSLAAGFLIVAGLFALMVILLIFFKERLIYPVIRNTIVKKVYE